MQEERRGQARLAPSAIFCALKKKKESLKLCPELDKPLDSWKIQWKGVGGGVFKNISCLKLFLYFLFI